MNILLCYGTRPEYIKITPLINEFSLKGIKFKTLCLRQHTSLLDSLKEPDYTVDIPEAMNRLDGILAAGKDIPEETFFGVSHVLVQGDTATAFTCAMAAFHRNIPVIHLEAGLRTYDRDNPYPEETYRQLISRIASIHLCPTEQNKQNLLNEKVFGDIYVVGNTVLDKLVNIREQVSYGNEVLVTLHRRENHDQMAEWFSSINEEAKLYPKYTFTLPIHPNPNVQKYKKILTHVNVIEPLPYEQFIIRLSKCLFAISDSGGIQEEASFLGKKVIVCRTITERPETLGMTSFLCVKPESLHKLVTDAINTPIISKNSVYGDGQSSKIISKLLHRYGDENRMDDNPREIRQ